MSRARPGTELDAANASGVSGETSAARTSGAADEHLDGAFRAEVGFHHALKALRGVDVHEEGRLLGHDLRVRVHRLQAAGRHRERSVGDVCERARVTRAGSASLRTRSPTRAVNCWAKRGRVGERSAGGKRKMPITLTTLETTASGTSEGERGKRRGNGGATLVLPFLSTRLFDVPPGTSRFRTIRALNLARAIRAGVFVARRNRDAHPVPHYRPPMVFFCRFGEYGGNRDITDDPNTRDPAPEVPRRRRATDESSRRDSIRASLRFRPRARSSGRLRRRSRRRRRGFFSRRRDRGNIGRQKERGANFFPDRDPDPSPPPPFAPSEPSLTVQNGYRRQGAPFHRHLRSRRLR